MKKLFLLLYLIPSLASAQKITINGAQQNYRLLTWDDFKGTPDENSNYTAMTYYTIRWDIDTTVPWKNVAAFPPLKVSVNFTDQSWVNTQKEPIHKMLRHEQGHFDIAIACAAELQKRFDSTTFPLKTAMVDINAMYKEAFDKCTKIQTRYENETDHSRNIDAQLNWNSDIAKLLKQHVQSLTLTN